MKKLLILFTAAVALICTACTGTIGVVQNHTISFETNGAAPINPQTVADGACANEPDPAPEKTGYDFAGWYKDSSFNTEYDFNTAVTSSFTLYARWSIKSFTVEFDVDGGSAVTAQTVEYDKTIAKPADPVKEGYDFAGWYLGKDFETARKFDFATKIRGNYKLYAKWVEKTQQNNPDDPVDPKDQGGTTDPVDPVEPVEPVDPPEPPKPLTFIVTFETNGGPTIDQATVQDGDPVARPQDPSKTGYDFAGWYSDTACTPGSEYNFDNAIVGTTTIYAKWEVQKFTVKFVVEEGPHIDSQIIDYKGKVVRPDDPEKDNAEFRGWYSDSKFKTPYDFDTPVTAGFTLYGNLYEFPIADEDYQSQQTPIQEKQSIFYKRPEYPKFINTTQTIPEQIQSGEQGKSSDNILTVTSCAEGLSIFIDYKATAASQNWLYNTIKIKDKSTNKEIGITDIEIQENDNSRTSQVLFPFTKNNTQYEVWIEHKDAGGQNPGTTSDKKVTVRANGGIGEFSVSCNDIEYSVNYDSTRKIVLKQFTVKGPSSILGISPIAKIRVQNGNRSENAVYVEKLLPIGLTQTPVDITVEKNFLQIPSEVIQINDSEMIDFVNQKQQLYFVIIYTFEYENLKYQQKIYENKYNWIKDSGLIYTEINQFPLIKIVSTENGGSNSFVKEPKAQHIKSESNIKIPDPYYENCTIAVDDGTPYTGQVKVRGNWTTNYEKKSLRIKFDNKHNMCGLNNGKEFKSWVLLSVFKDASMLRDAVAFKLFRELFPDYYGSDACLVELVVNGTYMGVYVLAEQQQANKNRIKISEPEKNSSDTQIGYLLELDRYYENEISKERFEIIKRRGDIKDYGEENTLTKGNSKNESDIKFGYTIKSDVYDLAQKEFIMKYMNDLWKICYEAVYNHTYYRFNYEYKLVPYTPEGVSPDEKCKNCINRIIDTTSLANTYIFNEIICDPDIHWSSFYMDIDFSEGSDKKLRFEAPWDFDSTMGNKRFCIKDTNESYDEGINSMFAGKCKRGVNGESGNYGNPWLLIFINQTWFKNLVKEQWGHIDIAALKENLELYINTNSAANYQTVFNYTRDIWGNPSSIFELCSESATAAAKSQAASAEYFKNWLMQRIDAVDEIITTKLK